MKFSIRFRLVGFTLGVVVLAGGAICLFSIHYGRQRIWNTQEKEARTLTKLVSNNVANNLYFLDVRLVRLGLEHARMNPDVQSIYVLDPDGTVLADGARENSLEGQRLDDPFSREVLRSTGWISRIQGDLLKVGGPIRIPDNTRIGFLEVAFSLAQAHETVNETVSTILIVTGGCLGVGGILAFVLATSFTRPILSIVEASRRIGEGNLNTRLPIRRRDELGVLADSINHMAANLRHTALYLDKIVESMVNSLVVAGPDRVVTTVNQSTLKLLGYERAELIGKPLDVIFDESALPAGGLHAWIQRGAVTDIETNYRARDGVIIPVAFAAAVMRGDGEDLQGIVCVAQDIRERRKAEEERKALNKQLIDASRRVGMADVATNVLHNVGNVLNSVNVSTGLVTSAMRKCPLGDLTRISSLLEQHAGDLGLYLTADPKGKQIPGYLAALAGHLAREQATILAELDSLGGKIEHIKQITSMQQAMARSSGLHEPVRLAELAEQALAINMVGLQRHEVDVVREYAEIPEVLADKHQVLQILVNLISNAKYAISARNGPERRLTLRVFPVPDSDRTVRIEVQDTGIGIKPEHLTCIFSQGFTTKRNGHGFGLHSSALAARILGGSLRVHSDGEGQGATFTLDLPVKRVHARL